MTPPEDVQVLVDRFLAEVDRRLPGHLTGLFLHGSIGWGEFYSGSDIDFVAVWEQLPSGAQIDDLRDAHRVVQDRYPALTFDGFHCTRSDLEGSPDLIPHRPAFYQGAFDVQGTIDINHVTWHELAVAPVVVRGSVPRVYTSHAELSDFTRVNLDTYWRGIAEQIDDAGVEEIGETDDAIVWITLGAARLHHLLTRHELTSKSGAGRYIIEHLDERWRRIAEEAIRIRERPGTESLYTDPRQRGQDTHDLLAWIVQDGGRLSTSRRPA